MLSSKKSYAMEIATKPHIMPSEISGLKSLHGFIKQENRVVQVFFQLTKGRSRQPKFIECKRTEAAQAEDQPSLDLLAAAAPVLPLKKPAAAVRFQFRLSIRRPQLSLKRRLSGTSPRGSNKRELN